METRYILPVAVATALHALVFVGGKAPHIISPIEDKGSVTPTKIFEVDLDPPDKTDEPMDAATPQPKGEPEHFEPSLDEPPPRVGDFEQPRDERKPQPTDVVARISAAPIGVPDGVDGASLSNVPVLSSALLDNPPRTRSQAAPTYPAAERTAGISGEVLVEFMVDETGRVQHARVIRSSHAAFESSTLRAVERWRFEPGKKNGRAVRFRMVVPVAFNLET